MLGFRRLGGWFTAVSAAMALFASGTAQAQEPYRQIAATMADTTVTLTGQDLSIEQLVAIARYGAKVAVSDELLKGAADSYGLMLQAQAEGVPVYLFNRGPGSNRENIILRGEPGSPEFQADAQRRFAAAFEIVARYGEDIKAEEVGRAMLVVDLNNMRYLAASQAYVKGIVDLLNHRVTPAVFWRGAIGEADFVPTGTVMRGGHLAYYQGVRMTGAEALAKAGLKPIPNDVVDWPLRTTSALTAGFAGLMVHDARQLIEWHDLVWAMDLNAMNGSIGPLAMPVQSHRPFPWANFAAARALDMLRGGYVFNDEYRIIQDPESLRATVWRVGSLWEAWSRLRDNALIQMNSTDHNPTIRPGISPEDSWELSTPQLMKYYVKGGKWSNGQDGYVLSNSNWDPYPLANDVEAFAIPLVNLMVAVVERIHRFEDPFFTLTDAQEVLKAQVLAGAAGGGGGGMIADALWQELKPLANPVAPDGVTADKGVGDLNGVPMLKLMRMQEAVEVSMDILAEDLLNAAFWLDIRKLEKPERDFGAPATAVWRAVRAIEPFRRNPNAPAPLLAPGPSVSAFMWATPATQFYARGRVAMPGGENVKPPVAQARPATR